MDNSDAPSDVATPGRNNGASVVSGITTQPLGTTDDEAFGGVILCGRDDQLATLQAAYDRVKSNATSEVILIGGESGTGKSALVESMRNAVTWNNAGFFVGGKFDQLQAITDPFSAIAAALSDVCDLILQSEQVSEWRERIASSLGSEGCRILSRVVSTLGTKPS